MMTDHLLDDKGQELLCKIGIELGCPGKGPQPFDLGGFARRIGGRQPVLRLIFPNLLCAFEPFREKMDERGIDIVDAVAQPQEFWIWLCHSNVFPARSMHFYKHYQPHATSASMRVSER